MSLQAPVLGSKTKLPLSAPSLGAPHPGGIARDPHCPVEQIAGRLDPARCFLLAKNDRQLLRKFRVRDFLGQLWPLQRAGGLRDSAIHRSRRISSR